METPGEARVKPIEGEIFRYAVSSYSTSAATYLVDLAEADGEGTCSCVHFSCRIAPARADGRKIRCKHISAAISYAWPIFVRAFTKEWESRGKANKPTPKSLVVPDCKRIEGPEERLETGEGEIGEWP